MELNKTDRAQLKEIIKKGILKLCMEWLEQTDKLINKEYDNQENAFDRCMEITLRSRNFYKEAMRREDYYRTSQLITGASNLLIDGYLTEDDFMECEEEIKNRVLFLADVRTRDL